MMKDSYQDHMHVTTLNNHTYMLLVYLIELCQTVVTFLSSFHAFMIKITYTPPPYAKLPLRKIAKHAIHLSTKINTPQNV
jgi:hypothetical protein